MKNIVSGLIACAIISFSGAAAAMHQITKTVKKNTSAEITDNFQFGSNCTQGNLIRTGYITRQPAHGRAEIVNETVKVTQQRFNFAKPFRCIDKMVNVNFVRYTPDKNYVGDDQLSVTWGNSPGSLTYRFTVK